MKKIRLIVFIFSLFTPILTHAKQLDANQLNEKIDKLIKDFGENLNIGIMVEDQETGKVIYKQNANRYYTPASNEKLFTAFAALDYLGPSFAFKTQLFTDPSKNQNGILKDNVYIKFSGDPTLKLPKLEHLLQSLSNTGIHQIDGKVILDDSIFDQTHKSPGSSWDDIDFCWGSPISALTIDQNCVSAILKPAERPNLPARLILPKHPQSMEFVNQVITRSPSSACSVDIDRTSDTTYTITGCIKTTAHPVGFNMAIHNPRANMRLLLNYLLTKNHIKLTRDIEYKEFKTPPKLLAEETSAPLQALVTTMLKDSDNLIADTIFKVMGAMRSHKPGSFDNGQEAMHAIISKSVHFSLPKKILVDGSGASRYNFLTPLQVITLLQRTHFSKIASNFVSALPISGVDGTLKYRLRSPGLLGKVRAKTGTETAITALSGYLETHTKHTLVFSILINNFIELPRKYKALENKICKLLIENY